MAAVPVPDVAIHRRRQVVLVVVLTVLLVFGGRLVWVQAVEGEELAEQARTDRLRTGEIDAPRGDIVDADGELLATSVERYNVGVNQLLVGQFVHRDADGEVVGRGAAEAARLLAPLLDRDAAELGAEMVGESTFVYLAKGLTPQEWREIDDLNIRGIEPERTSERIYPNGSTAGNVLGFVGRDGTGLAGLEASYDAELTGTPGQIVREIGNNGQVIPTGTRAQTPAEPGQTLHTTVDRDLQYFAQQTLDAAVEEFSAEWGAVVVEEIATGRLLTLADSGAVDPNSYEDWAPEDRGSRAVRSPFEPGSTGKIPTFAAALEEGLVTPSSVFSVPDRITMPNGQSFSDTLDHPTEPRTVAGILASSSNTGTVQVGDLLEDETRYEYLRDFGFGEPTGVELAGEGSGVLREPGSWDGRTRYTTMFGQGMSVTLLQNTAMAATLANDGVRLPLRLVDGTTDGAGVFEPVEQAEGERAVSQQTAETMLTMMEGVVAEGGTGPQGAIDGYRVAAKTGTAQIVDGAGGLSGRVGSFVGVAPAEDPQLAIGVVLYKPSGHGYGGTVAAPVFREVMKFALQREGVRPSTTPAPDVPLTPTEE